MDVPHLTKHLTQQLFQLASTTQQSAATAGWLLQHHSALSELLPLISKSAASVPDFDTCRNHVHLMHDVLSQLLGIRNAGTMPSVVASIQSSLHRAAQVCVTAAAAKASSPEQLANLGATVDLWHMHGAMPTMQLSLCKAVLAAAGVRVATAVSPAQPVPSAQTIAHNNAQLAAVAAAATSLTRVPVGVMAQLVRTAFMGPYVPYAPIETASLPPLSTSRIEPGRLQVRLAALTSKNTRDVQAERRRLARQAARAAGHSAPSSRATGPSAQVAAAAPYAAQAASAAYPAASNSRVAFTIHPASSGAHGGHKRPRGSAYSGLGASASTGRIEIAAPGMADASADALEQRLDAFRSQRSNAYHTALDSRRRSVDTPH